MKKTTEKALRDMLSSTLASCTDIGFDAYERNQDEKEDLEDRRREGLVNPRRVIDLFETVEI